MTRGEAAASPFGGRFFPLPDGPLPESHLSFLRWSDGGEFYVGDRCFQFFSAAELRTMLLEYGVPKWMPGAFPFASNGGCRFWMFDMRKPPSGREFPVVLASAGNLCWEDAVAVADTFPDACRGRTDPNCR